MEPLIDDRSIDLVNGFLSSSSEKGTRMVSVAEWFGFPNKIRNKQEREMSPSDKFKRHQYLLICYSSCPEASQKSGSMGHVYKEIRVQYTSKKISLPCFRNICDRIRSVGTLARSIFLLIVKIFAKILVWISAIKIFL